MAVKKIITLPDPYLRQRSKEVVVVDKKTKQIIQDLMDTVKAQKDPEGVGLSAVQIASLIRIFVAKIGGKFTVFINPEIVWESKKTISQITEKKKRLLEGCLSIPDLYGFVDRPVSVKLTWIDINGKKQSKKFTEKESVFVQHEYDHLNGKLFIDHILKAKGKIFQIEKNDKGKSELVEVKIE